MLTGFTAFHDDWTELFDGLHVDGLHAFRRDVDRFLQPEGLSATLDDTGETFVVKALVPGIEEKALQLELNQDVLTLMAERNVEAPKGYTAHRREREPFRFSRSFAFPVKVDPERVTATLDNGMLTVTVAKSEQTKPRTIAIKAS